MIDNFYNNKKRKIIPLSTEVNEAKPEIKGISDRDLSLISNVHSFFEEQGVIDRNVELEGAETVDEVNEILEEAFIGGLSEEEINPDFYDPMVLKLLEGKSTAESLILDEDDYFDIE